jgi:O-antigen ligase
MAAFVLPFSMPTGRFFVGAAMLLLVVLYFRQRKPLVVPATAWLALLFLGVAALATSVGSDPFLGFRKIDKLLWFMAIPVAATVLTSYRHLLAVLAAYALGSGLLSILTVIQTPVRTIAAFVTDRTMSFQEAVGVLWTMPHGQIQIAIEAARAGKTTDFVSCLVATGSMTDAQRLMVGIIITLGLIFICRSEGRPSTKWWILVVLQCVALVLNFKRGSWICAFAMVTLFMTLRTTWRHAVAFVVVVVLIAILPPVRDRLTDLRLEFQQERGGRLLMWTRIGPALIKQHPWLGIGYRCLTNKMMKTVDRAVEGKRNHLHSNVLQIIVEMGIVGFCVYLVWMVLAFRDAIRFVWRTRAGPAVEAIPPVSLLLALVALVGNGVVEYNFSDAEVVLIYGLVMGCTAAGCLRLSKAIQKHAAP